MAYLPGPSNIPKLPIAVPARIFPHELRAADSMVLFREKDVLPEFLYSVPRFLELPRNTLVPEICLLGRSNVGKSTVINALAGMSSIKAGSVNKHLANKGRNDGVSGLAVTSSRAGCTQTLNCYGFGPKPAWQLPGCEKLVPVEVEDDEGRVAVGGRSRNEVREDAKERAKHREDHQHSLYVMDMPGYGHNSREEWGGEILKYIQKRTMLKGAVLLIDASSGVKEADRITLRLLRDANINTAVVLTKGNRKELQFRPVDDGAMKLNNDHMVAKRCAEIWEMLRTTEREIPQTSWTEGEGWIREVFVTAAHAPTEPSYRKDGGAFGLSGLRLAICRLAGLVLPTIETLVKKTTNEVASPRAAPAKIVPFDEIMWAPEVLPASGQSLDQRAVPPEPIQTTNNRINKFDSAFPIIQKPKAKNMQRNGTAPPRRSNDPFGWHGQGDDFPRKKSSKSQDKSRGRNVTNQSKVRSKEGAGKSGSFFAPSEFESAFDMAASGPSSKSKKRKSNMAQATF